MRVIKNYNFIPTWAWEQDDEETEPKNPFLLNKRFGTWKQQNRYLYPISLWRSIDMPHHDP